MIVGTVSRSYSNETLSAESSSIGAVSAISLDQFRVALSVLPDRPHIDRCAERAMRGFDQRHRQSAGRTIFLDEAEQRGPASGWKECERADASRRSSNAGRRICGFVDHRSFGGHEQVLEASGIDAASANKIPPTRDQPISRRFRPQSAPRHRQQRRSVRQPRDVGSSGAVEPIRFGLIKIPRRAFRPRPIPASSILPPPGRARRRSMVAVAQIVRRAHVAGFDEGARFGIENFRGVERSQRSEIGMPLRIMSLPLLPPTISTRPVDESHRRRADPIASSCARDRVNRPRGRIETSRRCRTRCNRPASRRGHRRRSALCRSASSAATCASRG